MIDKQIIAIPLIELIWSEWIPWDALKLDARTTNGIKVPNEIPGVYEAKIRDADQRLTIGMTKNLRMRIKQGLVKGKIPHSSGEKIRAHEDTETVVVRWAITGRPAAVEEELHRQHRSIFGATPKYVMT